MHYKNKTNSGFLIAKIAPNHNNEIKENSRILCKY